MTNFGARILGNATSALSAQQALIANAGNNIANANTPGYFDLLWGKKNT